MTWLAFYLDPGLRWSIDLPPGVTVKSPEDPIYSQVSFIDH